MSFSINNICFSQNTHNSDGLDIKLWKALTSYLGRFQGHSSNNANQNLKNEILDLIKQGADLNSRTYNYNALLLALKYQNIQVASLLIDLGSKVNIIIKDLDSNVPTIKRKKQDFIENKPLIIFLPLGNITLLELFY